MNSPQFNLMKPNPNIHWCCQNLCPWCVYTKVTLTMQGYTATWGSMIRYNFCVQLINREAVHAYREMICTTKADSFKNNANNFII